MQQRALKLKLKYIPENHTDNISDNITECQSLPNILHEYNVILVYNIGYLVFY